MELSSLYLTPSKGRDESLLQTDKNKIWDPDDKQGPISSSLYSLLRTATVSNTNGDDDSDDRTNSDDSRTELDSHMNMPVVGRHYYIISETGKVADVKAFSPDHKTMQIPIVDAAVQYDSPYDTKSYILVIRKALHVPSMYHNLIPPFMLRKAGITVMDTPKIQASDPTIEDHSIFFSEIGLRIPLSLWGEFSYFPTSKPSLSDMTD